MGSQCRVSTPGLPKEKTDGVSEELLPEPLMWSNDYNSGLENFVESYNFFSVGISQERFVGLRQSSEVSRKWGAHT